MEILRGTKERKIMEDEKEERAKKGRKGKKGERRKNGKELREREGEEEITKEFIQQLKKLKSKKHWGRME